MRLVFLSCYLNHHLRPLSDALASRCDYAFISTAECSAERKALGWGVGQEPSYVVHYDREPEKVHKLLEEADVIFTGAAPEHLVLQCIRRNQPVIRYAERPLKKGMQWKKYLPRLIKWNFQNPPWRKIYMLCASAYTAGDYAKFGLFRNRCYKWGYFPAFISYDPRELMDRKKPGSILWTGRFLELKHPDTALHTVIRLIREGYDVTLSFIGSGVMEQSLRETVQEAGLQDRVCFLGTMKPEQVRSHMEAAELLLFTSDAREGWGAVVNEAMNSGCCVVASRQAGVTPFLIRDGENGETYGDPRELYEKLKALLDQPQRRRELGLAAYETVLEEWNPETAAERLLKLAEGICRGETAVPFLQGPCSRAEIVKEERK